MKNLKLIVVSLVTMIAAMPAFAQDAAHAAAGGNSSLGMGAAIAICIAALGGAFGQGIAAKAALEGIARNPAAQPKLFVPMIIALALIESLVIYAFVIAFQLVGKI